MVHLSLSSTWGNFTPSGSETGSDAAHLAPARTHSSFPNSPFVLKSIKALWFLPLSTRFHWLSPWGWKVYDDDDAHGCQLQSTYLAAAARRFLALAAPGSTDSDLAASSSLLEAIEMFFRLPITCIWSSLDWKVKEKVITNIQLTW